MTMDLPAIWKCVTVGICVPWVGTQCDFFVIVKTITVRIWDIVGEELDSNIVVAFFLPAV